MALTFDMGGRMDPAVDIMNFLVANDVCATIFATGVMSQTPQGQQVMAIIRAHPELFEIANHTMYHCDLARGGGGSPSTAPCAGTFDADRIQREMTDAEAILRAGTGQAPAAVLAPAVRLDQPGRARSRRSCRLHEDLPVGYRHRRLEADLRRRPHRRADRREGVTTRCNGSNVLFHLGGYETLDSLRLIVPGLRDRGLTLTSLSDMLQ